MVSYDLSLNKKLTDKIIEGGVEIGKQLKI